MVSKFGNHTHTCVTHFGSTMGNTKTMAKPSADMMAGELLTVKLELENVTSGSNHTTVTKVGQAKMSMRWIMMLVAS